MKTRKLGSQGLESSAIGLGCMGMSDAYGRADETECIATIHRALDLGVSMLNSSNTYGHGGNEEIIGRSLRGRRDEALINTKFGFVYHADGRRTIDGSAAHIQDACELSLKRLGVDHIDLYSQHRVDSDTPIEETVGAMARLVEEGKVRAIGLSEPGADTLRRAHATHLITTVETEYSLWSRDAETDILPVCRELGIGFVAYSPLGRGFLAGAVESGGDFDEADRRRILPRFQPENLQQNQRLIRALDGLAVEAGLTAAQLSLAWVLAQGNDIVPIPGTKQPAYMTENAEAAEIILPVETLSRLDEIFAPGAAAGERYPDHMLPEMGR